MFKAKRDPDVKCTCRDDTTITNHCVYSKCNKQETMHPSEAFMKLTCRAHANKIGMTYSDLCSECRRKGYEVLHDVDMRRVKGRKWLDGHYACGRAPAYTVTAPISPLEADPVDYVTKAAAARSRSPARTAPAAAAHSRSRSRSPRGACVAAIDDAKLPVAAAAPTPAFTVMMTTHEDSGTDAWNHMGNCATEQCAYIRCVVEHMRCCADMTEFCETFALKAGAETDYSDDELSKSAAWAAVAAYAKKVEECKRYNADTDKKWRNEVAAKLMACPLADLKRMLGCLGEINNAHEFSVTDSPLASTPFE